MLLLQARAAVALNSYGEAAHLAQSALVGQNDLTMKKAVFEILAQCYSQQTNYQLAIAYKDSLLRVANELSNVTRQKLFESRQVQFDIWQKQHELDSFKTRQRLEWAFMALGVVAFLLLVWAFVQQRRAARQQRRLAAIELERRQERLDTMRRQFEAEQLLMQNEKQANERAIEQRSRELMSKALQTAKHNDALRQVINALESPETVAHSKEIAVKRSISALRHQLSASAEWKDFTTYFEQSNEQFLSQLKRRHPSLTANEVRYLSLVYINLSPKEIALLLNITPEYCKKKKQQVARKMGLSSPHHLFAYLTSLA